MHDVCFQEWTKKKEIGGEIPSCVVCRGPADKVRLFTNRTELEAVFGSEVRTVDIEEDTLLLE
jgi:hypothetical protein